MGKNLHPLIVVTVEAEGGCVVLRGSHLPEQETETSGTDETELEI
jgi:hypothetical protein